jgi:hypothetical protein
LLAGVESGELSVSDSEVGEALLAEVSAPYPHLNDLRAAIARHASLVFPGGIESAHGAEWLPPILESSVLETHPADHFNRQIDLFTQSLREWVGAGDTVLLVTSGAGRTTDVVRAAGLEAQRTAPAHLHLGRPSIPQGGSIPHHDTAEAFLTEPAGENARYYRAHDESGEMLAGFYADGRVRLADAQHRLAGIVQNGRADLLEIADNTWSELFVRVTPEGRLQLELRGGPYDARVFTCDQLDKLTVNA